MHFSMEIARIQIVEILDMKDVGPPPPSSFELTELPRNGYRKDRNLPGVEKFALLHFRPQKGSVDYLSTFKSR